MSKTEFELLTDERSRFETELALPLLLVIATAVIAIFSSAASISNHLGPQRLDIPVWAAVVAGLVLLAILSLRIQRPRRYEVTDQSLDIVAGALTYRIPFAEISEVVCNSQRGTEPVLHAVVGGVFRRIGVGIHAIAQR